MLLTTLDHINSLRARPPPSYIFLTPLPQPHLRSLQSRRSFVLRRSELLSRSGLVNRPISNLNLAYTLRTPEHHFSVFSKWPSSASGRAQSCQTLLSSRRTEPAPVVVCRLSTRLVAWSLPLGMSPVNYSQFSESHPSFHSIDSLSSTSTASSALNAATKSQQILTCSCCPTVPPSAPIVHIAAMSANFPFLMKLS